MKKNLFLLITVFSVSFFVSCDKDEDDTSNNAYVPTYVNPNNSGSQDKTNMDDYYTSKLSNTSWKIYEEVLNGHNEELYYQGVLTFDPSKKFFLRDLTELKGDKEKYYAEGNWKIKDSKINLDVTYYKCTSNSSKVLNDAKFRGILIAAGFSPYGYEIKSLSESRMKVGHEDSDNSYYIYQKVNNPSDSNSETGTNEGPRVIDYNYTATKTSITVKFQCNSRPTRATVKYGTTTPNKTVSSTISGNQVSATVTSLSAGTKYYFRCEVSNSSGTTTSDTFTAMTNY